MNRMCKRAVAAAGALALTGGTVLAASAGTASANSNPDNFSYGASADGFLNVDGLAFAQDSFGEHVRQLSHFSFSHLVTGGGIVDTAFPGGATSSVAKVNVLGSLTVLGLTARVVNSSCSYNDGDPTGQTTITGGLVGLGGFGEPVDPSPSVDEEIDLPGGVTVFLNDQLLTNRELTVHAMLIDLPGETITVGTSVCERDRS
jgi:hypothetical protein